MPYVSRAALPILAIIAVLAMAPVSPEAANVLFLVAGIAAIPLLFFSRSGQLSRPIVRLPLLGLLLVAISYLVGSGSPEGLIGLAYFAPVFAVWPLLSAWSGRQIEGIGGLIGLLALCGVAGASVVAIFEVVSTGTARAGGTVANPIHFADVALLAGALSCAAMVAVQGKRRWLFIAGPVLSLVPVVLSGTRGALVAVGVMMVVAFSGALLLRLISIRTAIIGLVVVLVAGGVALVMGASQLSGVQRVLYDLVSTLTVGMPQDGSTSLRLQMYQGGFRAFMESPIFGHGPLSFMTVARELGEFEGFEHLHNDLADFAASAGALGLIAYGLFLVAPIVEVLRAPASWSKPRLLVLVSTLIAGYFTMGLTNAMFGILSLTTYYAAICVITGVLVERPWAEPREVH
jgi:O-antigen ligase